MSSVEQWHPAHRRLCIMTGWFIALSGSHTSGTARANWTNNDTRTKSYIFVPGLGGTNIITIGLHWFYWEYAHFRAKWSASNKGFDLARYFGTKFTFYPHPLWDYIIWWDTEWPGEEIVKEYWQCQPLIALLQKNHKVVRSVRHGGKKGKKVMLRPPSCHNTQWKFMQDWCGVGLGHIGISFLNFTQPFIRGLENQWGFKVGRAGGENYWFNPNQPPFKEPPTTDIWQTLATQEPDIWYRWDMDDGNDNRVLVVHKYKDAQIGSNRWQIITLNYPYWVWFFGMMYSDVKNEAKVWDEISDEGYALIWWWQYKGPYAEWSWGQKPTEKKAWILLYTKAQQANSVLYGGLTTCLHIAQNGPFALSDQTFTTDGNNRTNFQIAAKYKSYWQWGGTTANTGETVDNPCPPNQQFRLSIENPARAAALTIHPWDIEKNGYITKEKLRQIIGPAPQEGTSFIPEDMDSHTQKKRNMWESEEEDSDTEGETSSEEDIENITKIKHTAKKALSRTRDERRRRHELRERLLQLLD